MFCGSWCGTHWATRPAAMHKPQTTFGNVKADVLALEDTGYRRIDFCSLILGSSWNDGKQHAAHCQDPGHRHG